MSRAIPLALLVAAGCGGAPRGPVGAADLAVLPAKRLALGWGFTAAGDLTQVFLAITDENGQQRSHPLGRYPGHCARIVPAPAMKAMTGASCLNDGGAGLELHAVVQGGHLLVFQLAVEPGVEPDPMSREQLVDLAVPVGVGIELAP